MSYSQTPATPHIRPIPKKRVARNITSGPKQVQAWDGQSSKGVHRSPVCEIAHKMHQPMIPAAKREFVPVYDVDGYVNALMYHGISEEQAEVIRKEHCEALAKFDRATIKQKTPLNVPRILQPVNALLEVTGDKVKLILSTSMWKLNEEYLKKCKRPPIGKLVRAMAGANYPQANINKAIDHYNWVETHQDELDEEFERLFPTTGSKKSAVVKKASKAVKKF